MMRQYHEVRKAKVAKNEAPPWWRQPRREKLEISTEEVDGWLAEGRDGEIVARRDALVLKHEATEQRKRAGALRDKRQRLKGWLLNKLVKFNPRQDVWNDALAKVARTCVLRRSIARAAAGTVGGCADRRRGARAGRGRWRAQSRRGGRIPSFCDRGGRCFPAVISPPHHLGVQYARLGIQYARRRRYIIAMTI
jgi:hypothetical protein